MIIFYEHLVTLKYEADFLRSRRKSAATWLFLSNRYLLIARALSSIAPISPQVSDTLYPHEFVADIVQLVVSTRHSRSVRVSDVETRSCNNSPAMNSLNFLTVAMLDVPLHGMHMHMKHG